MVFVVRSKQNKFAKSQKNFPFPFLYVLNK